MNNSPRIFPMGDPQDLPNNHEQWKEFECGVSHKMFIHYDYRNDKGTLYSCITKNVTEARDKTKKHFEEFYWT